MKSCHHLRRLLHKRPAKAGHYVLHGPAKAGLYVIICVLVAGIGGVSAQQPAAPQFNDSHFHLTNYIQEGIDVRQFLDVMGTRVGRSTLFGIPLQQTWSYPNSGDFAPTYYLQTDAPLYYYSFTDAQIAMAYLSLAPEQRQRFEPMITGFNPADMYAADHGRCREPGEKKCRRERPAEGRWLMHGAPFNLPVKLSSQRLAIAACRKTPQDVLRLNG